MTCFESFRQFCVAFIKQYVVLNKQNAKCSQFLGHLLGSEAVVFECIGCENFK